jgi:glycosyltransferase involved in cell wall biosynthesis
MTTSRPLVSVVVPFLNVGAYLAEAIDGVVAQTYDRWELLLVDDGSTDDSADVARRAAAELADVTYVAPEPEPRGSSAARNVGVERAAGTYVAFLDGDDVWLPAKLEEQVALLEAEPRAVAVYGRPQYWASWSGGVDRVPALGVTPGLVMPPAALTLSLRSRARTALPSDLVIRTAVLREIGGFEDAFRGMFDDQVMLAKLTVRYPVLVSDRCWTRYRQHPASQVGRARDQGTKLHAGVAYLEWLDSYLRASDVNDRGLRSALRQKRFRYRHPRWNRLFVRLRR